MPQGKTDPANSILIAGQPIYQEFEVVTATEMLPGRLVMNDTVDYGIKLCTTGATTCLGVLDVEPNELATTNYGTADQARVMNGSIIVLLIKDSGVACVPGTKLVPGDRGQVHPNTTAGAVVAMALETGTVAREAIKCLWLL
jgi:hypothetical protein